MSIKVRETVMVRNRMYVMLFIFSVVAFGLFMLCLKWSDRPRGWTFELWMNGHAPDINRYSIIYIEDRNNNDLPFGYPLYHDAMRAAGLRPLLLTERLFRDSGMYFKSENVKYFSKWNTAIHKAIFNQAFMDITSSNAILVRGRAYFDSVKECGVVCDVVHEATPLHNR